VFLAKAASGMPVLLALGILEPGRASVLASVVATIVSSLVFFELVARYLRYSSAARETNEVFMRLGEIRKRRVSRDDLILPSIDYNAVVEAAPLIFSRGVRPASQPLE